MFDQLMGVVKDQATDFFVNQTEVPNNKAEEAAKVAGTSILESLKDNVLGGNLAGVRQLLSGGGGAIASNPIVTDMITRVSGGLVSKLGIGGETAQSAASGVIPMLMQTIAGKFMSNDSADSAFDLGALMQLAGGGNAGGLGGMLKDAAGGKLGDMLGGFFGKK